MRDIANLDKTLLASELEVANSLFYSMRNMGYPPAKISAMIYRAGRLDGVASAKDSTKKFHMEYHRLKERVKELEAQVTAEPVVIIDDLACVTCPLNEKASVVPVVGLTQMSDERWKQLAAQQAADTHTEEGAIING